MAACLIDGALAIDRLQHAVSMVRQDSGKNDTVVLIVIHHEDQLLVHSASLCESAHTTLPSLGSSIVVKANWQP